MSCGATFRKVEDRVGTNEEGTDEEAIRNCCLVQASEITLNVAKTCYKRARVFINVFISTWILCIEILFGVANYNVFKYITW